MTDPINDILPDDLPEECRQIAEVIGLDALLALSASMGGERIYIPLPERLASAARNRRIRAEFNGRNYRDLAIKYRLTVRWVRAIVAGENGAVDSHDERSLYKQQKLF